MMMHKALHERDEVDIIIQVSRKEGGRGLTHIEDSMDVLKRVLDDYIKKSNERLIAETTIRRGTKDAQISIGS